VAGLLTEPHAATEGLLDAPETSGRDLGGVRRPAPNEEEHAVSELTESVSNLIDELAKLPGIGKKSAERLAYHILRLHRNEAAALADAIRNVKENVSYCRQCYNLAEGDLCTICRDPGRQEDLLCVVEQPRDLMALEQTGVYRGLYHVLLGRIAPLEGIGPDQLTIEALVLRVRKGGIKEVVMATNPTVEGDGTALHISNLLAELPVRITRLARGITTGSVLEFANKEILSDALSGRQEF
jgi:recombination protein RecR